MVSSLTPADVCRMIETSAKAGVVELKFGGLHVTFGRPVEKEVISGEPFTKQPVAPGPVNDLTEEQHTNQSKASHEDEEVRTREEQLAQALIEDPQRYEELLRLGDLSDESDELDDNAD